MDNEGDKTIASVYLFQNFIKKAVSTEGLLEGYDNISAWRYDSSLYPEEYFEKHQKKQVPLRHKSPMHFISSTFPIKFRKIILLTTSSLRSDSDRILVTLTAFQRPASGFGWKIITRVLLFLHKGRGIFFNIEGLQLSYGFSLPP